jgi:signal transduction histidine kinase/protein-S-isoprenylcysteine O-methyltransferase Ste14
VILAVVVTFYAVDFLLISRYDRQRRAEGSGRSWDFTIMMIAMAAFLVAQPVFLPWLGLRTDAWWGAIIQGVGIVFLAGALSLHCWARRHLRQFYAERVELQPGHQLVDSGPYAQVRHPMFTSFFMYAIGLLLVNPALPMLLAAVYIFWDFSRAAKQEEALLSKNLPGYADYIARTPPFLPRLRLDRLLDIRSTDPDDARRRKLLNILLLGLLVLTLLLLLVTVVTDVSGMASSAGTTREDLVLLYVACLVTLFGIAFIFVINHYWSGSVASWLFLLLLTVVVSFSDQPRELISGRSLIFYAMSILMASVLLRPYTSFIMAGLTSLLILGIGLTIQVVPNILAVFVFFIFALVSWLSAHSLEVTLQDLRAINRELDQRVQDRTRALAEAMEREHATAVRNKTILEAIGDGVLVTDSSNRVIIANPAASRLAQRNLENRPLREALAGIRPDALAQIEDYMVEKAEDERPNIQFEWNQRTVAANIAPVSLALPDQPAPGSPGAHTSGGNVMVLRDVTREAELDRMKTVFLGAVSHELRTPMAAIKGYVEILSDLEVDSLSETGRKYLGIIDTNVRQLLGLANDLIDVSRIEVGEIALYREWTRLEPIVEAAADTVQQEFEKQGLSLVVQIEPGLPELYLDSHRLTQVLLNLLTNAYKYTVEGGATVKVSRVNEVVQIVISDTGVGMTEEEQAHLFERFFRAGHEVVQKAGGSGLGLVIAKSLVELHGGTISAHSEYGVGTTFIINLPIQYDA